jgi:hypothetical protein
MLFFWYQPWGWSGFYHFGLLPLTSFYPYWFALPLSLLVIALYGENNKYSSILLIPVFSIVFLVHPLTGSFLVITTVVKVLTLRNKTWKQKASLLIMPPLSLLLIFLWPYYPVLEAVLGSNEFSKIGFAGNYSLFYSQFIFKISPALLGIPFILIFLKKKEYFIPLGLFLFTSIYAFNYFIAHNSTFARYIIFIGFFLQISIVMGIKEIAGKKVFKYFSMIYTVVLLILIPLHIYSSISQISVARAILYKKPLMQHLNIDTYNRFSNMRDYINPKDVVMANLTNSWKLPAILGCKVVGVLHSNPFMEDFFLRKKQTELFFNESTSDHIKEEILKQYKVKYILYSKKVDGELTNAINHRELLYQDEEYTLLKVL